MAFREDKQQKRPSKMVIYTLILPWMLIEPTAYGGFMMLVLLSKTEDIYISNPLLICIKM